MRQCFLSQLWVYLEVGLMTCNFSASRIFQVYLLDQATLLLLPSSCVSKSSRNSPHKISVTVQFYICLCADIMHSFNLKISSPSFPYFLQLLLWSHQPLLLLASSIVPSFTYVQCPCFQWILPFCFNYKSCLYSSSKYLPYLSYPWVPNFVVNLSERIVWS